MKTWIRIGFGANLGGSRQELWGKELVKVPLVEIIEPKKVGKLGANRYVFH